jgi:hypothetical protein
MFLRTRPGRGQEFRGAVCQERSGRPEVDVCTSRFEPLSYLLGPWAVEGSFVSDKGIEGGVEELWRSGAGPAEELETLRLSRQGCVEVPLASTEPCVPLSNPTSAHICLHLKSPDLIVTINLRVNTRSVKGEELRSVRSRAAWLPSSIRSRSSS